MKKLISVKAIIVLTLINPIAPMFNCGIVDILNFSENDGENFGSIEPLDSDIGFSIFEGYDDYESISEPKIKLLMSTEKIYPCCNFSIVNDLEYVDHTIIVHIHGVFQPNICLTAIGPATTTVRLNITEKANILKFNYEEKSDTYIIVVTDSSIQIIEVDAEFTIPNHEIYWRYPKNSFAYLCRTTLETTWIYEDFIDTLMSKINLTEHHFPDYGAIPYPDSTQASYYNAPARYFIYEKEEDFDKAGEILESYYDNVIVNYQGVKIFLLNWMNKSFSK